MVKAFLKTQFEVAAGVKQQLEADAAHVPGMRMLDEHFMVIHQAMGIRTSGREAAAKYVAASFKT